MSVDPLSDTSPAGRITALAGPIDRAAGRRPGAAEGGGRDD
ncbi:hypothetical protein IW256_006983 [Actinomadura viridis]|uniref:Uncharacterized protein n=1 Tax=Actinomadura viridis TaxID=58110 RepID=A0A931GND9_9ACTN|nr:hypothetical protein [Actinomadura viridis]